jgi:ribosomal protein L32E
MKHEILDINELLDIDLKKFERDNSIKLVPSFNNFRESSAKKETTRSHFEGSITAKKVGLMIPKKKVSEYHFAVGLGKRNQQDITQWDSQGAKSSAKKVSSSVPVRAKLENVQIKKHLLEKYLSGKLKSHK